MYAKIVFVFCIQALLVQFAFSQCTSPAAVVANGGLTCPAGYGRGSPFAMPGPDNLGVGCPYGYDKAWGLDGGLYPAGWAGKGYGYGIL